MKNTVLKIALAGLCHDIGKFAQGSLDVTKGYLASNEGLYQPQWNGRHTHIHATYTAAFIEQMSAVLPKACNSGDWGEGDSFINLTAGHHNPKTPMQWIIAMADRISSGQDRATFEEGEKIAFQNFKKTRLLPVLESLGYEQCEQYKSKDNYQYRYPLAPISAANIFAIKQEKSQNRTQAEQEYLKLFNDFTDELQKLLHREENIDLWSQHFDSLFMTYTSMIPAARVNDVIHDVSLYDHSKTTAAFATALYLYHHNQQSLNEKDIKDGNPGKFLLVTGDFYGIQDFIFSAGGELNKNRSKILRGRSFAVSMFSELAADMLCRSLDLSHLSIILNAAGKFTILAPNTPDALKEITQVEEKVNEWLFKVSYGQSTLGITATPAAPNDFTGGNFYALWNDKHQPNLEKKKFKKINLNNYGGVIGDYLDGFDNDLEKPLCPLCGKRPADKKAHSGKLVSCRICRDHIMLGTFLVKGERLAVLPKDTKLKNNKILLEPIFDTYQLTFSNKEENGCLKLFDLQINSDGSLPGTATARLINGHIPVYNDYDKQDIRLQQDDEQAIVSGEPVTFNHIADKARQLTEKDTPNGVAALGILKADVDNLGTLMACGLPEKQFTISRVATISRQLNNFFTIYLPHLLKNDERFYNTYTVFAGGDDLFLIAPWRVLAELALTVRQQFTQYVCGNEQITFSAGISVQKTHVPVDKLAESSEEALEEAKKATNSAGEEVKNSISMFGATVNWNAFQELVGHKSTMKSWLEEKLIGKAMMYRFNLLIELANRERHLTQGHISLADMECLKWRSKFKYALTRNINQKLKGEERTKAMAEIGQLVKWLEKHGSGVRIPLWQLLYEQR